MLTPYRMASLRLLRLSSERCMKKLTVMGMMGQMQGMRMARRPPRKPMSSRYQMLRPSPEAPFVIAWILSATGAQSPP